MRQSKNFKNNDGAKRISQYDFNKMKEPFEYYIRESDVCLRTDEYIIVHLDGVQFTHKYYTKLDSDAKKKVVTALVNASCKICSEIHSVRIAYVCSDEVSFVLDGKEISSNENNRLNKIVSKFTSLLTLEFYKLILPIEEVKELAEHAIFSAKAFNLPSSLIEQYLKLRLTGCKKLIYDKKESYESKQDWEKYGYLIVKTEQWNYKCVDFENEKIHKTPQNEFFNIAHK